ncbi:methyltransferase domain-containing protein [Paenibacillus sp. GYB003]|uniref:methyltransferase domain-containing protein n=1 Tax=Paenibacillus sp. GYB003 TaxID=2994392 RepID=UPI002F963CB2
MNEECPFCSNAATYKKIIQYSNLIWVKCNNCNGGRLKSYISELERESDTLHDVYKRYIESSRIFDKIAKEKANWLLSKWNENFIVVEIGAGLGSVAKQLREINPSIPYMAIEPNSTFADYLMGQGTKVFTGDPLVSLENAVKEVISLNKKALFLMDNVLEHVPYPTKYLNFLQSISPSGSIICIEVPNEAGLKWRAEIQDFIRGFKKPPTFPGHINLFTKRVLRYTLLKASFVNISVKYKAIRSDEQVAYLLQSEKLSLKTKLAVRFLKFIPVDYLLGIPYWLRGEAQVR